MKSLNYSYEYLKRPNSYAELFDGNPELYHELSYEDAMRECIPFGQYTNMLFSDLIWFNYGYFNYIKNLILKEKVSNGLVTFNQRVRMIQAMTIIEREYNMERMSRA